jgi:outer membrane autotransporter protein
MIARMDAQVGKITLTPQVGIKYAGLANPSFTETGGGALSLAVAGNYASIAQSIAGLDATLAGPKSSVALRTNYGYQLNPYTPTINANLTGAGATGAFATTGVAPSRQTIDVGVSLQRSLGKATVLFADYDAQLSGNQTHQSYSGGVRLSF